MTRPTLSILIPSLHSRRASLVRLLSRLDQPGQENVEILVDIDESYGQCGMKRNRLVSRARGLYLAHIDDDDLVAPSYIASILGAIATTQAEAIAIRGVRTDIRGEIPPLPFSFRQMGVGYAYDEAGVLWRSPGHLCAIWHDIAKAVRFPETDPEDIVWCEAIQPMINSVAQASDEVLYYYLWDSKRPPYGKPH